MVSEMGEIFHIRLFGYFGFDDDNVTKVEDVSTKIL